MSEPSLRRKRKRANVRADDAPELSQHPKKHHQKSRQRTSHTDQNSVNTGDGKHRGLPPTQKLEVLDINDRGKIYPTILPSLGQSSQSPSNQNHLLRSNLCKRCAQIPLDTLLSRPHKTQAGQSAKNLSPVPKWEIDSCSLCSLLSSTMNLEYWPAGRVVPLRSHSSNKLEEKTWSSISTNMLEVGYSTRLIVSQPEGIEGPVQIIKGGIEMGYFETVKSWINFCRDNHTKMCSVESFSPVQGLKLIDCQTLDIILAEGVPYLALSYVWGPSSAATSITEFEALPNTIRDAITVTLKLGYRYLWVDRYCIDQENDEEKSDQCGKMDQVYQNAELTIIAAVGEDPSHGLPGVSLRKRDPQHLTACAKIGDHFLISTEFSPRSAVDGTKWKTRAWTYQEGILSRRRLVFTEKQTYFECYGMHCSESVHFPLESMHRKDMQGFKSDFCSTEIVGLYPKGGGMFPKRVGTTSVEIVRRIEEYSMLDLTNPSDILKGMLGIFNAFRRGRLGIDHCSGVPILPPTRRRGQSIEGWTPTKGFFLGLFWDIKGRPERRNGFPSWSWTGWHGHVKWEWTTVWTWSEMDVDAGVQLSVELIDGKVLKWEEFQGIDAKSNTRLPLSNIIRLAAWTIDILILKRVQEKDKDEYKGRLRLVDGGCLDWRFTSTSRIEFLPGRLCKGIILGHDRSGFSTGPAVLVIGKVNERMERIGLGWIDQLSYKKWKKNNGVWEADGNPGFLWTNPSLLEPLELVKSWKEVRIG
ncbi:heterokaryon incompatibility protein-domain-containing protein [Leptodontidium sp. MPI-SDFR-AT-0119]|nr:heterokaryon incompatibility protein-domain-containing protein [Leptodontidium sp. MPI-SDFR-AT-0119]